MSSTRATDPPPTLEQRLRGHLELARISNGPTVVTNVLVGAALAGAPLVDLRVGAMCVAMLLLYVGGMYLNDICDYQFDRRHRPERPLVRGAVSRAEAAWAATAAFGLAGLILGLMGLQPLLCGVAMVALIAVYDLWHKDNPVAPLVMGLIRGMVYVTTFAAFAAPISSELLTWAALLCGYILGLTVLARGEAGDRPGRARVPLLAVALLTAPATYLLVTTPGHVAFGLAATFGGWVTHCLGHTSPAGGGADIGRAIGGLLAGICLLDSLALAACGQPVAAFGAMLCFGATLLFHRHIKGT